jgi:hypothetical protein
VVETFPGDCYYLDLMVHLVTSAVVAAFAASPVACYRLNSTAQLPIAAAVVGVFAAAVVAAVAAFRAACYCYYLDLMVHLVISAVVAAFAASPVACYRLNSTAQLPIAAAAAVVGVFAAAVVAAVAAFRAACYCLSLIAHLHFDNDLLLHHCP